MDKATELSSTRREKLPYLGLSRPAFLDFHGILMELMHFHCKNLRFLQGFFMQTQFFVEFDGQNV